MLECQERGMIMNTENQKLSTSSEELIDKLIPLDELEPKSIDQVVKLPSFFNKIKKCESLLETEYSGLEETIQNALVLRRLQQMTNTLMLNPIWKEMIEKSGLKKAPATLRNGNNYRFVIRPPWVSCSHGQDQV